MLTTLRTQKTRILTLRCLSQIRSISGTAGTVKENDIIIVGGGPAGLALAAALGASKRIRESLRITLVEASDLSKVRNWNQPEGSYSNRVSSITNASQAFLSDIGGWAHVEHERTRPVEEMQVWDGISDARLTFSVDATSTSPELSRLTENLNLQRALLRQLEQYPSIEIADNIKVQSIATEDTDKGGWPLVHLSDGRTIRTRLLVGADGFNSPVRSYAKIESYGWAYDTHAVVATMCHPPRGAFQSPNTVAYQRFLPTGPIAFLPLSDTVSSLVWSTKPHLAPALKALAPSTLAGFINAAFRLPEESMRFLYDRMLDKHASGSPLSNDEFDEELAFRERSHLIDAHSAYSSRSSLSGVPAEDAEMLPPLVTSLQPGSVASFPLRFSHAESYIGEGVGARTVLIGDAAHTIHPLAGQGLNLGLADAEALSTCIRDAVLHGADVGSYTALMPYSSARYFENHKMMSAVDKLHKLFSVTSEPVVWARSVGMEVINELDSVKMAFMMSAGSNGTVSTSGPVGLGLATSGVETFARGINMAHVVSEGVLAAALAGVQQAAKYIRAK